MSMKSHVKPVPPENDIKPLSGSQRRPLRRTHYFSIVIILLLFVSLGINGARYLEAKVSSENHLSAIDNLNRQLGHLEQVVASNSAEDAILLKIAILKSSINKDLGRDISKVVHEQARIFKRDPNLILAMMRVESNFNPNAVSSMGAIGLMQVMPQWKEQLGIIEDLTDIETNVKYGLQILAFYDQMYKDLETALSAYNRGPGRIDGDLMKGIDPNRNGYARKVLRIYEELKSLTTTPDP